MVGVLPAGVVADHETVEPSIGWMGDRRKVQEAFMKVYKIYAIREGNSSESLNLGMVQQKEGMESGMVNRPRKQRGSHPLPLRANPAATTASTYELGRLQCSNRCPCPSV